MKNPIISIIIPTYSKSADILEVPLKSIANQRCSKEFYEVIIADNQGGEGITYLAKKYKARLIGVDGRPSQGCRQVNLGAKIARSDYILLMDHDIEISPSFIRNFIELLKNENLDIDAWYIPYKIIARGKLLTKIRNFEEIFYKDSIIATPRMIKRSIFWKTESQYDPQLNSGPADWDLNNQLRLIDAKTSYLKDYFYHHEERMSFWKYLTKRTIFSKGEEIYKNKWRKKNIKIYNEIVKKQYDPFYRLFWIFVEKGKWRNLLVNIHLYLLFLVVKIAMSIIYFLNHFLFLLL